MIVEMSFQDFENVKSEGYVFARNIQLSDESKSRLMEALNDYDQEEFLSIIMQLAIENHEAIPRGIANIKDISFHDKALAFMIGAQNGSLATN